MEFNLTTLGILVAVWMVGYLLGLLEAAIKNERQAAKKAEKEETAPSDTAEKAADDSVLPPEILEPEVLTVYQRISGALKLRLEGEVIEYSDDLSKEQKEKLIALVVALRPWLETEKKKKQTKAAPPPPPKKPHKTVSVPVEPPPAASADVKTAGLSIVDQIDRILQVKLEDSPLGQRGIRLRSSLGGGLLIQVGLDEYEWVEDIPEQEIQAIIREAIAEWESEATP